MQCFRIVYIGSKIAHQRVGWLKEAGPVKFHMGNVKSRLLSHLTHNCIFLGFAAVVVIYFIKSVCPCCAGAC